MKTIKTWLSTIAMMLCSITANAHDLEVGGIYYNFISDTDLTLEVTYKGNSSSDYNEYSGKVTIPSAITYKSKTYRVTSIGSSAFYGCNRLAAINIPADVTSIGESAFRDCSSLTSITLPDNVTSIRESAFEDCI